MEGQSSYKGPRPQEAPGPALTGRGVPCLYKADEISFSFRNKQVGGGGNKLKRAENGLEAGSWHFGSGFGVK